jgi:hypothetical protein
MNDPIVDEVRRIRDAHAAMFTYDLDAIFNDIKEQEKKSGLKFVTYPPRKAEPNKALQPAGAATSDEQRVPRPPEGSRNGANGWSEADLTWELRRPPGREG